MIKEIRVGANFLEITPNEILLNSVFFHLFYQYSDSRQLKFTSRSPSFFLPSPSLRLFHDPIFGGSPWFFGLLIASTDKHDDISGRKKGIEGESGQSSNGW